MSSEVNTEALLRAKGVGHAYYNISRGIGATEAQKQRANKVQTRLYGNAWNYDLSRDVVKHGKYAIGARPLGQILASSQADISSRDTILLPGNDSKTVDGEWVFNESGTSQSQEKATPNSLPSLSLPMLGGIANGSRSLSNPNRVSSGSEAKISLTDDIQDNTQGKKNHQRVISDNARKVVGERKGKPQMRAIANYDGGKNFLNIAYPAIRTGLTRGEMPQIPSAFKDGYLDSIQSEGVKVDQVGVKASSLLPSQSEIDGPMIVEESKAPNTDWINAKPILVSKDGFIADGHHRWAIMLILEARGDAGLIQIKRIDLPLSELLLSMEDYGQGEGIPRRDINDHNYAHNTALKARRSNDTNQTSLFDLLGGDMEPAQSYANKSSSEARKSKEAFKKQAKQDLPTLANDDAVLGELFAFAQENALSKPGVARNVLQENNKNEPIQPNDQPDGTGNTSQISTDAQRTGSDRSTPESRKGRTGNGESESGQPRSTRSDTSGGRDFSGSTVNVEGTEPGGTGDSGNAAGEGGLVRPGGRPLLRPRYVASRLDPAQQDHVIDASQPLAPAGNKAKFAANIRAIELLRQIESENRNALPSEKAELAAYTGWGWAGEFFNKDNPRFTKEFAQLTELLSKDEFSSAAASTTNAHYTAPEVIAGIWDAVEHLGFKGGEVLEPAGGIGHFFGLMPKSLRKYSHLSGVELDDLSARIFTKLYPNASIKQQGFEESKIPAPEMGSVQEFMTL